MAECECSYGFCMFGNKYNSVRLRVACMSKKSPADKEVLGDVKLKKNKLSLILLRQVRAVTIKLSNKDGKAPLDWPTDCELEIRVLSSCSKMLKKFYTSRYKTTIAEDKELLTREITEHMRYALISRIEAKRILISQITLLELLIKILNRVLEGESFKKAYMERVPEVESSKEVYPNRRALRRYLRSCYYYMIK